jgi:hypothetical protein
MTEDSGAFKTNPVDLTLIWPRKMNREHRFSRFGVHRWQSGFPDLTSVWSSLGYP